MMQAVKAFFRDWQRLLYWIFFKPSVLCAHIRQIEPDHARKPRIPFLRACRDNLELRVFLLKAIATVVLTWSILAGLTKLTAIPLGIKFSQAIGLLVIVFGVSIAISVSGLVIEAIEIGDEEWIGVFVGGTLFGVIFGFGVFSLVNRYAPGIPYRGWVGFVVGVAFVAWFAFEEGLRTTAFVQYIIALVTIAGVVAGAALSLSGGRSGRVSIALAFGVGATRLLFYPFEIWLAIMAYRRSLRSNAPEQSLLHSPVYFDDLMVLPQPFLSSLLLRVAQEDLTNGLRHIVRIASNPFHRWAAQKALRKLLEADRKLFFLILHSLLPSPERRTFSSNYHYEIRRARYRYVTATILLAGLMASWPKPRLLFYYINDYHYWPIDYIARVMTFWLQGHGKSEYALLAEIYFRLLHYPEEWFSLIPLSDKTIETFDSTGYLADYLSRVVKPLVDARELPHGEEFYQSLRLIEAGLRCESLQTIAKLRKEFDPLFEINDPLRPPIIATFRHLRDAAVDAAAFLTTAHENTRHNALLKAKDALNEALGMTLRLYEPEHSLSIYEPERLLMMEVIHHWLWMFDNEGKRVTAQVEVKALPNPYVAGRPIRPEDGPLFAGRRDEMKQIEEKLQTGVGLVIWGQRRIGKTSILLHLRERMPHDLLPVYLNLQLLMANTTGGFLYAVARESAKQLSGQLRGTVPGAGATGPLPMGAHSESTGSLPLSVLNLPSAEEFNREPYLSFNHLLEEVAARLQPGQRVLLSFDEFEELEQRVKDGKIEKEIFTYLRGVTQTGRGFALMFAGLHTLEEMTHDYWNPFFQSVQTIRIGYLSELDAEQLIRDPIEQFPLNYELEAINRITQVTRSHPYLTQSLCHNLINRLNDPLHRSQKATREDVDAVLERTLESSGYYFDDYVWGWSSADEQLALSLLAEAEDDAAFSVVEKHLGREAALEATRKLVAREILAERTATGELVFRFQIPLARMWVRRTKSSARLLLERNSLK